MISFIKSEPPYCGTKLYACHGGFEAHCEPHLYDDHDHDIYGYGETPEEAVEKCWANFKLASERAKADPDWMMAGRKSPSWDMGQE